MDFHGKKRKELQALCKEHNIPANLTNLEMANKLASLLNEKEKPVTRGRSCLKNLPEIDSKSDSDGVNRKIKKVRFSPENDTIEFVASQKKTRLPVARKGNFRAIEDVESVGGFKEIGDIPVRVTRSRAQILGEVGVVLHPDSPAVKTRGRRVQKGTNTSDNLAVEFKKGGETVVDDVAPEKNLRQRNGRKRSVEVFEHENVEPEKATRQTKRKGRKVEESELGKTEVVGMGRIIQSRTNLEIEASALHNEVSKRTRRDVNKPLSSPAEDRNNLEGKLEVVLPFVEPSGRPRRTRGRTKPVMPPADNGDKVHGESEVGVKEPLQRPRRTGGRRKSVMPQADNGDKVQVESEVGVKEPLQQPHRRSHRWTSILPNAENRDKVEGKLEVVLPLEEPAKHPSRNIRGKSIAPQIDKVVLEDLKEYEIVPEPEGCLKRSRHDILVLKPAANKETVGRSNSSNQIGGSSKDTDMFLTKENVRRSRRNNSMQDPVAISDGMRGAVCPAGKNKRRKQRIDPILEEETVMAEAATLIDKSPRRSRRDATKSETIGPTVGTGNTVGRKKKPTPIKSANIEAVPALCSTPAEEDAPSFMPELAGSERKAETLVPTIETGEFVGVESQNPLKSPCIEVEAPSFKATSGIETPNTEDAQFSITEPADSDIHLVSSSKKDLKHGQSCKIVRASKEDFEEAGIETPHLDKEMANVNKSVRIQTGSRNQEMEIPAGKSAYTAKKDYSEKDGIGTSDLEVNTANTSAGKSVRSQTQYRLQGVQIPVSESLVVTQDVNMPPAVDAKNSQEDCIYRVKMKELETELETSTVNAPGSNQSGCSGKDYEDVTKVAGEATSFNPSNEHHITSVILPNNDVLVEAAESQESSELQGKIQTTGNLSILEPRVSVPEDGERGDIENNDRINEKRAGGTLKSCSGREQGREQGLIDVLHGPYNMNSAAVTLEKTPAFKFVKLQSESAGHVMAFSNKKLACPAAVQHLHSNEGTAGTISGSDGLIINKSDYFVAEEANDTVEVMEQEGASSPLRDGALAHTVGGDGITCVCKEENLVEVAEFDGTDSRKDEILSDPSRETSTHDSSGREKNYIKVLRARICGDKSFEGTTQSVLVSPLNAIIVAEELTENEVDACSFSSPGMTPLQANTNSKVKDEDQVDTQDARGCGMLGDYQMNNAEREEASSLAAETCDGIMSRQEDFVHEALDGKCHLERKEEVDREATYASAATDEENNVGGSEENTCTDGGIHHFRQEDSAQEALDGTCHLERKEEVDREATYASAATDEEENEGGSEENIFTDDGIHHSRQEDVAHELLDGTCHAERKEEVGRKAIYVSAATDEENNVGGSKEKICIDDSVHSLGGIDGELSVVRESSSKRSCASLPEDDRERRSCESLEREGILPIMSEDRDADRAEILHCSIATSIDSGILCRLVQSDQSHQDEETGRQLESERFDQRQSKETIAATESEHEKSLCVGNSLLTTCKHASNECYTTREEVDQLKAKYSTTVSSSKSGKEAESSSYETTLVVLAMSANNRISKGADGRFSCEELQEMTVAKETKNSSSMHKEVLLPITAEETADGGSKSKWHGDEFENLSSTPIGRRNLYEETSDCDYREGWQGDQLKNLFATPVISTIRLPDTQTSACKVGNSDRAMPVGSSFRMASHGRFCRGTSQETVGAEGREHQTTLLREVALPGNSYEISRDGLDEAGGVEQVDACSVVSLPQITAKDCEFKETQMTFELTESTSKCMKGIDTLEKEHKTELLLPGSPIGSDIVGLDHGDEIKTKYLHSPAASARGLPEECNVCSDISSEVAQEKLSSASRKADSYNKDTVDVLIDANVLKNNDLKSSESDGNIVVVVPEMDESASSTSQKLSDKKVQNIVKISELFDKVENKDYADQGQKIFQDLYERTFVSSNECVSKGHANEALKEISFDFTVSPSNLNEANIDSGEPKNVGSMGDCPNIDSSMEKKQDLTNALQISPGSFFHQLKGEKEMVLQKASSPQLSVPSCQGVEQESCAYGEGLSFNIRQTMADAVQDDKLNNIHGFGMPGFASDEFQGDSGNALTSTSEPFLEDDKYRRKCGETMTQSDPDHGCDMGDDLGITEVVPQEKLIDTAHSMSKGAFVSNTVCEASGQPACGNEEVTAEEPDQAQSSAHGSDRVLCAEIGPMEFGIGSQTFSNWEMDLPFEGDEVERFNARASSTDFTCEDEKDAGPNKNISVDSDLPTSEDVEITLDDVWMEVDKMSGDESKDVCPQVETFGKVDPEDNQTMVEEKYEDGRAAIQKESLASFDFAVDEGTAEDAQTGELIERKNVYPEVEEGKSPSVKQFFSATVKRKIAGTSLIQAMPTKLFMSDFKENVPGFKREHPGALTEAKLVKKRHALEDLRRK